LDTSLIIDLISQQFQIWVLFDSFVITATTSKAKAKQASKKASAMLDQRWWCASLIDFKQHSSPVASSQDQAHVFARLQGE
jgi:hypothetical protein